MKKTPQAGQPNGVRKTDYGVIMTGETLSAVEIARAIYKRPLVAAGWIERLLDDPEARKVLEARGHVGKDGRLRVISDFKSILETHQ